MVDLGLSFRGSINSNRVRYLIVFLFRRKAIKASKQRERETRKALFELCHVCWREVTTLRFLSRGFLSCVIGLRCAKGTAEPES